MLISMSSNNLPKGNRKAKESDQGRVNQQKVISKQDSLRGKPSTSYPTFEEQVRCNFTLRFCCLFVLF